jgi:hypothetical protein
MPRILLDFDEVEDGLPPVCMRCGARATVFQDRTFTWTPQWIGALAFLLPVCIVLMIVLRKRLTVAVPLCRRHQNHWRWRFWFLLGSAAVVGLAELVGAGLLVALSARDNDPAGGLVCCGCVFLLLGWLITVGILQSTGIRPLDISDHGISLSGVSQRFVDAVYDERDDEDEDEDDEDDYPPPRRRPGRQERVHDPDFRRRRAPPDSYRERDW